MIMYTYNCPNCGRVEIARPMERRHTAICLKCETKVKRCPDDFPLRLPAPFKEFLAFGVGGKKGKLVTSRQERNRVLNPGWQNDMNWNGDRELVTPNQFDEMMGTDSTALGARNKD